LNSLSLKAAEYLTEENDKEILISIVAQAFDRDSVYQNEQSEIETKNKVSKKKKKTPKKI